MHRAPSLCRAATLSPSATALCATPWLMHAQGTLDSTSCAAPTPPKICMADLRRAERRVMRPLRHLIRHHRDPLLLLLLPHHTHTHAYILSSDVGARAGQCNRKHGTSMVNHPVITLCFERAKAGVLMMPRDHRLSKSALRHESPCVPLYVHTETSTARVRDLEKEAGQPRQRIGRTQEQRRWA